MIVISGALVLVALVLLLIGVAGPELAFVYASIAVSLVSLGFLVIGIRQRRDEVLPGQETNLAPGVELSSASAGAAILSAPTAVSPTDDPRADRARSSADASAEVQAVAVVPGQSEPDEQVGLEQGGTVLVVAGRPRYHVEGCRYLTDKAAQAIDVLDALEEGYTPCGVCKPDTSLAELKAQDPNRPADEHRGDVQDAPAAGVGTVNRPFDADSGDVVSDDAASDEGAPDEGAPAVADSEIPHGGLANEERLDAGLPDSGVPDDTTPNRKTERPDVDRGAVPVGGPAASSAPVTSGATSRTQAATARTAARASTRATTTPAVGDTRSAPSTRTPSSPRLAKAVPASKATPATRASRTTPSVATPAKTGPAATPARAARAGSVAATPAKTGPAATPARAARAGSVVVIPDRGRFHRAECRYVRGVGGATTMSKAAASKQGYDACGVCKP